MSTRRDVQAPPRVGQPDGAGRPLRPARSRTAARGGSGYGGTDGRHGRRTVDDAHPGGGALTSPFPGGSCSATPTVGACRGPGQRRSRGRWTASLPPCPAGCPPGSSAIGPGGRRRVLPASAHPSRPWSCRGRLGGRVSPTSRAWPWRRPRPDAGAPVVLPPAGAGHGASSGWSGEDRRLVRHHAERPRWRPPAIPEPRAGPPPRPEPSGGHATESCRARLGQLERRLSWRPALRTSRPTSPTPRRRRTRTTNGARRGRSAADGTAREPCPRGNGTGQQAPGRGSEGCCRAHAALGSARRRGASPTPPVGSRRSPSGSGSRHPG